MKNAYSYFRFSTPEQEMGDSERRQVALAKTYCERNGLNLIDTVGDKGVSAYHGKHRTSGSLASLLKRIKPQDALIIEDCDRWSRESPLDALAALRSAVSTGLEVHFLRTGTVVTRQNFDDMSVLVPNFFGSMLANEESKKKGQRIHQAWQAKLSRAAAGQQQRVPRPCWMDWLKFTDTTGKNVLNEAKATVVRRLFDLAAQGHGLLAMGRMMRAEGVPPLTKRGAWCLTTLRRILLNKAVLGYYVPRHGQPVAGYFPAIVDEKLFYAAQARLKLAKKGKYSRGSVVNLFTGVARCPKCGHGLTTVWSQDRKYARLICSGAHQGRTECGFHGAPISIIEPALLEFLGQADVIRPVLSGAQEPSKLDELQGRLAAAQKQAAKLTKLMLDDDDPPKSLYDELKAAEAESRRLQASIEDERSAHLTAALTGYSQFLDSLPELAGNVERRAELRRAISAVVEDIALDPKGNGGAWRADIKLRGSGQRFLVEIVDGGWAICGFSVKPKSVTVEAPVAA
jgi:DNA invertase Pin-like site-specific DNA recombinase